MMNDERRQALAEAFVGVYFRERTIAFLTEVRDVFQLLPVGEETTTLNAAIERELEIRKERASHE